jgi:carbon-monoxide dehydrogenase small subunit
LNLNDNMAAGLTELKKGSQPIRLHLNGQQVVKEAPARTHLGDFVREQCGLTGTHLGCEHGVCGSCTVLLDDQPVRSCITFAVSCENKSVRTIEGYDGDPIMTRLREAFSQEHALQCGYCTPGMLATAYDIVRRLPDADEKRIRVELSGNLCRCTGYVGIVRAIQSVLAERRQAAGSTLSHAHAPAPAVAKPQASRSGTVLEGTAREALPTFVASDSASGAPALAPAATSNDAKPGAASENRKGWSHIEDSFMVDFPPERVWAFMSDVNALASCLPGAEILETDGHSIKGKIAIKFGPITAAFAGAATLDLDAERRTGMLRGAGTDSISHSRAKGDVGYTIVGTEDGRQSRVEITLDHMLQGPLAQFSRSGLVKDFVSRMVADFGRNLAARMGGASAEEMPAAQTNGFKLMASVLWGRVKRLFVRQ